MTPRRDVASPDGARVAATAQKPTLPGPGRLTVQQAALAGNAALQRLVGLGGAVQAGAPVQRGVVVQRDDRVPAVGPGPLGETLNIVNKGSAFKVKVQGSLPATLGLLEVKKVSLDFDGTSETSAPGLTGSAAPIKASGGSQSTSTIDPRKAADADLTRARVYAADLQSQLPMITDKALRDAVKAKLSGEWQPGTSAKVAAGVAVDSEAVSTEVAVNFCQIDLKATDPAKRFKPITATVRVGTGKVLEKSLKGAATLLGQSLDVKLRFKVSGSVEVGPKWEALESELARRFGRKLVSASRANFIEVMAREEAFLAVEKLSEKLAKEATEGLPDEVKQQAMAAAKRKAMEAAEAEGLERTMIDVMLREATLPAASKTDLVAVRAVLVAAAERGGASAATRLLVKEAVKDVLKASWRRLGAGVMGALVLGPVDIGLVALDMLAGSLIELVRAQDVKQVGMTAQLVRDNYVEGYRTGLGGPGRSAGGSGGSGGSPEGAALLAGLADGRKQFEHTVGIALAGRPELVGESRSDAMLTVSETLRELDASGVQVAAKARPKLEQMLVDAYVQANTGWLDKLFGNDVKEGKTFADFLRVVRSNLDRSADRTTTATLKNGVRLTMVSLDYTGENARRFRTADGQHVAHMGGPTASLSGWITDDGTPLEKLYPTAASAEAANAGDAGREQSMSALLDTSRPSAAVTVRDGSASGRSLQLNGPGADNEQFAQHVRTAGALGRTLASFSGCTLMVRVERTGQRDVLQFLINRSGTSTAVETHSPDRVARSVAPGLGLPADADITSSAVASHLWSTQLSGMTLANFPLATVS